MATKPKILVIPYHPGFQKIRIRTAEIARRLTQKYEVYVLDWHAASGYSFARRVQVTLRDMFRRLQYYPYDDFFVVETPFMHRPLSLAPGFNTFWLMKVVKQLGIDIVVNGSYYLFSIPKFRNFKYTVDLADLPACDMEDKFDRLIDKSVDQELRKADKITVSSLGLVDYAQAHYHAKAYFLPNGSDLQYFAGIAKEDVEAVKKEYGLSGKWVIGHIGHIGDWVDVDFMVKVFLEVKKFVPQAVLWMVGSSPQLKEFRAAYHSEDVIFTGAVNVDNIEPYFWACDVGVVPSKKSDFQDLAFHIKLIEYAAAEKIVVASDLNEIKRNHLPNVLTAPLEKDKWVELLLKTKDMKWQAEWRQAFEKFDWKNIASDFIKILEEA